MQLNPETDGAKLDTLKTWLTANANGVQDEEAAALLNALATPAYRVFRSNVTRAEIYKTIVAAGESSTGIATEWVWAGYKGQSQVEQDTWKEMMMGGCDFNALTNRKGVLEIFGTAGNGGANRTHIFNVGRRRCTVGEKLFVVDVASPPLNTGNVDADARGSVTNPDLLGVNAKGEYLEGPVTAQNVSDARNRP